MKSDTDFTQSDLDRLVAGDPYGYAINTGPLETRTPVYGIQEDIENPNCYLVLTRWIDNTGLYVRYYKRNVRLDVAAVEWLKKYNPKSFKLS